MDRDLDCDYMAIRWMAHVRRCRSRLMLSQGNLLLGLAGGVAGQYTIEHLVKWIATMTVPFAAR
jgi:hypothetical protein